MWMIWLTITIEAAIIVIVITFWNTIKNLLNTIFVLARNVPLTTSIGLEEEIMIAGSKPDKTPTTTVNETKANSQTGLPNTFISTRVCNKSLTNGTTAKARRTPITKEINVSKVDSSIKRMNNSPREEPKRRRVAISFALKPAWATVKLI